MGVMLRDWRLRVIFNGMPYREETDATRARAEVLQREVDAAREELGQLRAERVEAARLRRRLQKAERKLAALQGHSRSRPQLVVAVALVALSLAGAGVGFLLYAPTEPPPPAPAAILPPGVDALGQIGVGASAIETLRGLSPTQPELDQLGYAKRAGASDETCVELVRAARARKRRLAAGTATAAMLQAGASQATVVALARLGQLGWGTEVVKMRRAGVTDSTVLQLARMRSLLQLSISAGDVVRLRQAGMGDNTILKLAHRGVSGDEISALVAQRQRGLTDTQILARFGQPDSAEAPDR